MAHWEELRHLFTEFFGGGEIFPPLSWRTSGFRAHTKLTRGSPPALPPCPEPCGLSAPAGSGPVRSGGAARRGSAHNSGPGAPAPAGETLPRPSLAADPGSRRTPVRRFHLQPPQPQRAPKLPRKVPHRGRTRQGPQHPRRTGRAPRTHRRRHLLRPPAPQQQHQAAGSQVQAAPPRLHAARSGAPGPALRRGHSPARQRGSLRQLAPAAPTPAPAPLPHSPASPGSSPPGTTVFLRSGGGWGGRCRARCCCYRPSPLRGDHNPPPFPQASRLCRLQERAPPLPAPHLHRAGSWTPGLFFAAEVAGVGGCRGSCCQCQVAPLEGRVAGVGLAWLSLGLSGPAQVRRLGGQRKLPARARCERLEGLRCLPDPERAAPAVPARLYPGAGRSVVPGEGARAAGAPCPARPE